MLGYPLVDCFSGSDDLRYFGGAGSVQAGFCTAREGQPGFHPHGEDDDADVKGRMPYSIEALADYSRFTSLVWT